MHIALAPFRPGQGVTEDVLMATSDAFEDQFARHQDGIIRRIPVRDGASGFADIVFLEDETATERVLEAEQNSEACATFFSIMDGDAPHGVYEVIKSYE
ncbi:hypothetical protein GCM10010517_79630 [Streptosporangium fragile]|uniref:Antibiotic biosynthesis monooxygenase n=1 Tax=Streptosporangium fragile TaxID=46186 RepID=A0ABP6IXF8_9ACTN